MERLNTLTGDYVPPVDPTPEEPDPEDPVEEPEPEYGMEWEAFAGTDPITGRDSGFYQIVVHSDTKKIYLAHNSYVVEGVTVTPSDSNNGLSVLAPKKTENAAFGLLETGRSCHIYIRSDASHNNKVWNLDTIPVRNALRGGETFAKAHVITWYGTAEGNRPKVIPPPQLDRSGGHGKTWWDGLHFVSATSSLDSLQYLNNGSSDILVQDCEMTNVELVFQSQDGSSMNNYVVHRCISHYTCAVGTDAANSARPSGAYLREITNFKFTENLFKWGGWNPNIPGAAPNKYDHGLYFNYTDTAVNVDSALLKHNIFYQPAAHSFQLRAGGTSEKNICIGQAIGPTLGYRLGNVNNGTKFRSIGDVVLKTKSMYRMENSCRNGVCSPGVFGLVHGFVHPNVEHFVKDIVIAHRETAEFEPSLSVDHTVYDIGSIGYWVDTLPSGYEAYGDAVTTENKVVYHFDSPTQGDELNLLDPTRDIGAYFSLLTGETVTDDEGVEFLESRPKSTWDSQYDHAVMHAWIWQGYQPEA